MHYVLIIHLKTGVQELFLPVVQNRAVSLELNKSLTQKHIEVALSLDVFDDVWTIRPNADVFFESPLTLFDGLRIDARLPKTNEGIIIFVEKLDLGRTQFQKFRVSPGIPITVGSDRSNIIRYNAKALVSAKHLSIEPSPAGATLIDLSRNGSFINGKRVNGRQILKYGDTIYILGLKLIWLDSLLAVNMPRDGYEISGLVQLKKEDYPCLKAEAPAEDQYYSRSPRRIPKVDDEPVEIDSPPRSRTAWWMIKFGPTPNFAYACVSPTKLTAWVC